MTGFDKPACTTILPGPQKRPAARAAGSITAAGGHAFPGAFPAGRRLRLTGGTQLRGSCPSP